MAKVQAGVISGSKLIHWKNGVRGELYGYPEPLKKKKKRNMWVLEQIKPKISLEAKITKMSLFYLGTS